MQETFLTEFEKRGYFSQCTDRSGLSELMSRGKIKAYIGFDCTAPSLHVGSLMQIMCLRLLQKYGHQPIILLGGGTTLIGDPSGKDETRKILVGSKVGEGVFGVSFKMKGPPKNMKTTVNPIKTLTPRFITRMLEKIKSTKNKNEETK